MQGLPHNGLDSFKACPHGAEGVCDEVRRGILPIPEVRRGRVKVGGIELMTVAAQEGHGAARRIPGAGEKHGLKLRVAVHHA